MTLLVPLALQTSGATAQALEADFGFHGQPIAPQCLEPFSTGGAEAPPATAVVDLEACAAMRASPQAWTAGPDGRRSFRRDGDKGSGGYFGYRYRGQTSDGVAVLEAWDNGGGSGTYTAVFLVRREASRLLLVRSIEGGDRCVAGIAGASIEGRDLTVDFHLGAVDLVALADALASAATDETPELDLGAGPPNDCAGAARYRYSPAISGNRELLGLDYRPTSLLLRGEAADSRCLSRAFGTTARFLDRPVLRDAAGRLAACLAAGNAN